MGICHYHEKSSELRGLDLHGSSSIIVTDKREVFEHLNKPGKAVVQSFEYHVNQYEAQDNLTSSRAGSFPNTINISPRGSQRVLMYS